MQLVIDIKNESLANKIIKILEAFKDDGVKVVNYNKEKKESVQNWREIGMNTHSANRDDDEYLYDAAWEFYNEKHFN